MRSMWRLCKVQLLLQLFVQLFMQLLRYVFLPVLFSVYVVCALRLAGESHPGSGNNTTKAPVWLAPGWGFFSVLPALFAIACRTKSRSYNDGDTFMAHKVASAAKQGGGAWSN